MSATSRALAGAIVIGQLQNRSVEYRYSSAWEEWASETVLAEGERVIGDGAPSVRVGVLRTDDDVANVFIPGSQVVDTIIAAAQGYVRATTGSAFERMNRIAFNGGRDVVRIIDSFAVGRPFRRYRLYGHSYGGMVMEAAARLLNYRGSTVLEVQTYGAPKLGLRGACLEGDDLIRRRWMNFNDPVPLLPSGPIGPRTSIALVVARNIFQFGAVDLNMFVHGSGGMALLPGGPELSTEPRGLVNPYETLSAIVAGDRDVWEPHLIRSYVSALRGIQLDNSTNTAGPPRSPVVPREDNLANIVMPIQLLGGIDRSIDVVIPYPLPFNVADGDVGVMRLNVARQTISYRGNDHRAVLLGVDMANAKMRPGVGFTRARVAGVWYVYLSGVFVAQTPSSSRARTIVKKGNALLRYFGNLSWSASGPPDGMAAFLSRAFAGDGYTPALPLSS